MNIRIKDIAELAKVSSATVSLALNNKRGISNKTRERVLSIASALAEGRKQVPGTYNGTVRFLKIAKSGSVLNRDHDIFIASYIDGMEQQARSLGYNLEMNAIGVADIEQILQDLNHSRTTGLIVLATELSEEDLQLFADLDLPLCFIDTSFDFQRQSFVDMDNSESVFEVIKHLQENGHSDIGIVCGPLEYRNFYLRYSAFKRTLESLQLSFNPKWVFPVGSRFDDAYRDMKALLESRSSLPTALFAVNDLIAYACIKAMSERGISVPQDISIVGFDDLPMSSVMDPPLTTMTVSKTQMGAMAVSHLIANINAKGQLPPVKFLVGGKMQIRKSVRKLEVLKGPPSPVAAPTRPPAP